MNIKKMILVICLLALCGCSKPTTKSIDKSVSNLMSTIALSNEIAPNTHKKKVYDYFLPYDMGIVTSNQLSSVLQKDGYKIVMNFNIASIIISEYYTNLNDDQNQNNITVKQYTEESLKKLFESGQLLNKEENEKVIEKVKENVPLDLKIHTTYKNGISIYKGVFYNINDDAYHFELKMKRVNDDYYIHLDGTIASFTSVVPSLEVDNVLNSMMHILKSIDYDKEEILKKYSAQYDLKLMQEKFKKNQDYIYRNLNKDGYLEDLISEENLDEVQ